jgi:hypothetical protein
MVVVIFIVGRESLCFPEIWSRAQAQLAAGVVRSAHHRRFNGPLLPHHNLPLENGERDMLLSHPARPGWLCAARAEPLAPRLQVIRAQEKPTDLAHGYGKLRFNAEIIL